MTTYRKKLIEVNIPLQAINKESAKDASLTHGHPSTLHRYWARRPLAACRSIIFASMVDDPSECADEFPTIPDQNAERNRLHEIIKRLIIWKNSNDENILAEARYEIAFSVARNNGENLDIFRENFKDDPKGVLQYLNDHCPAVYDPFCGGGSIPLEAQRLGLRARGSDLNPLPVLLTKAMIELPPKFHNQAPINPDADTMGMSTETGIRQTRVPWKGTAGLANDIRYYGAWNARGSTQAYWTSLSESAIAGWRICHRSCLALGAYGAMCQSRLWYPDAFGVNFPIIKKEG